MVLLYIFSECNFWIGIVLFGCGFESWIRIRPSIVQKLVKISKHQQYVSSYSTSGQWADFYHNFCMLYFNSLLKILVPGSRILMRIGIRNSKFNFWLCFVPALRHLSQHPHPDSQSHLPQCARLLPIRAQVLMTISVTTSPIGAQWISSS